MHTYNFMNKILFIAKLNALGACFSASHVLESFDNG